MNREGEDGPQEGEAQGGEAQGGKDNVIAFPGARVRAVPSPEESTAAREGAATPVPGDAPDVREAAAPDEAAGGVEAGMTLDAFERAVRSAVREKLGESAEGRPQGADELVAQVFSALTGKDAKTALAEVRQRLAEPLTPAGGTEPGEVIDLGAVREARQKASLESAQKIGGALRDSFNQFLANLAERQGMRGEITLDAAFFKQHGTSLLGNLFQGLAAALMQQHKPGAPAGTDAPAPRQGAQPTADAREGAAPVNADDHDRASSESGAQDAGATRADAHEADKSSERAVQVKLDLGSILAGLFRRREPPPPDPKQD